MSINENLDNEGKEAPIKLDDLLPRKTVKGGRGQLIFGVIREEARRSVRPGKKKRT